MTHGEASYQPPVNLQPRSPTNQLSKEEQEGELDGIQHQPPETGHGFVVPSRLFNTRENFLQGDLIVAGEDTDQTLVEVIDLVVVQHRRGDERAGSE